MSEGCNSLISMVVTHHSKFKFKHYKAQLCVVVLLRILEGGGTDELTFRSGAHIRVYR